AGWFRKQGGRRGLRPGAVYAQAARCGAAAPDVSCGEPQADRGVAEKAAGEGNRTAWRISGEAHAARRADARSTGLPGLSAREVRDPEPPGIIRFGLSAHA